MNDLDTIKVTCDAVGRCTGVYNFILLKSSIETILYPQYPPLERTISLSSNFRYEQVTKQEHFQARNLHNIRKMNFINILLILI